MKAADPGEGLIEGLSQDEQMNRISGAVAACLAVAVPLAIVAPTAVADTLRSTEQAESRINARLASRVDNPHLGPDLAVVVLDSASGRVVFSRRADKPMLPASNMKVITATTAIAAVGPATTFRTAVFAGQNPGEIVLQGGGDPLLTSGDLATLATSVAKALDPATPVTLATDLNLFPKPTLGPGWPRDYVPSVASSVMALARLGDYSTNPARGAVRVFRDRLKKLGFTVQSGSDADVDAAAVPLAEVHRHTAADAVRLMLRESENNVAEVLYRHVALATGQPATWAGARAAAGATLAGLGIDIAKLDLDDGSGLSRDDRVTALALANVIRMTKTGDAARFSVMYEPDAMPISGESGTLDARYGRFVTRHSRCARGDVRGKTGTLFDTIGLTGVTNGADGQPKAFSILVNDRPQRFSELSTRQAADGLAATINGCW